MSYQLGRDVLGAERIVYVPHTPLWHHAALLAGLCASVVTVVAFFRSKR